MVNNVADDSIQSMTDLTPASSGHLLANLLQFARLLRALGLDVTPGQVRTLCAAVEILGLEERGRFRDAARAIIVGRREHEELFDRAFEAFFRASILSPHIRVDLGKIVRRAARREQRVVAAPQTAEAGPDAPEIETPLLELQKTYSDLEILRSKDFAELTPEEVLAVRTLMQERPLVLPPRRTRRLAPGRSRHHLDVRRTLRQGWRHGGEWLDLAWRERRIRPRPLVVLCDISGSMDAYSRLFLQFIYSLRTATDRLEAFVFGTRLTRITRQIERRNVEDALRQAAASVVDWGGGTRIGESLRCFNRDWGRRVLGQGAVVLVISDGWDRGELEVLEAQLGRLEKRCDRLIWLNPLIGSPGYEPLTEGIRIVLKYADDFLPIHNLKSLDQLRDHLVAL